MDRVPRRRLLLACAACALAAAAIWAAVALHQMRAHGRPEVNEMQVVAGLTWMDSAKALPLEHAIVGCPTMNFELARVTQGGREKSGQDVTHRGYCPDETTVSRWMERFSPGD